MEEQVVDIHALDKEEKEEYFDVVKKLEDNAFVDELVNSEGWKIFEKTWKRIADTSRKKLAITDPSNTNDIIKLQLQAQFYDNVLPETKRLIKQKGKEAYELAEERGWLNQIWSFLKKPVF